jgi:hypothetical protein
MIKNRPPTKSITWRNEKRKLKDLVAWEHNPRRISEQAGRLLAASLEEFGQIQTLAIEPDGTIIDGHQRESVWAACDKFGLNFQVDVRVSSRKLTDKERGRLVTLLHEGTTGEFDWEKLANMPGMEIGDFVLAGFDQKVLLDEAFQNVQSPEEFSVVDENLPVEHICPKCGYKFSGGTVAVVAKPAIE